MPMLLALANPRLSAFRISLNSGNISSTSSAVPSLEALSTTITSEQARAQCSRSDSRHSCTYFFAFHTTITTETRTGRVCGGSDGSATLEDAANSVEDSTIIFDILNLTRCHWLRVNVGEIRNSLIRNLD